MFKFIYQGTQQEFDFFKQAVDKRLPEAELTLESIKRFIKSNDFHCSIRKNTKIIYMVGMIAGACYGKFGYLSDSEFCFEE